MPSDGLKRFVEAVPGDPLPHGLLGGCVPLVDATDPHTLLGTEHLELSCTDVHDTTWCPPEGPAFPNKTFERPGVCDADPVTVYAGIICSTMGWTYEDSRRHAEQTLRLGASRALEEWFMREVLCTLASDETPAAGALSVTQALSLLESRMAIAFGGRGVIHAPVAAAAYFSKGHLATVGEDGCLRTLAGNLVVLGAGYDAVNVGPPDCTVAPEGEFWIYATPNMRIWRGPEDVLPEDEAAGVRLQTNERLGLAERTYVPELACCMAWAVRAKAEC